MRIRKSKKGRQHNGQMKKDKATNKRSTNQFTEKHRPSNTNSHLKPGMNACALEG